MDLTKFALSVVEHVRLFVQPALDAVDKRIDDVRKELEAKIAEVPAIKGEKGDAGPQGEPGAQGERGPQGEKGLDGAPGKDGEKGLDGAPGEKGEKGEPGIAGKDGADGINGKDGAPGERGEKGADGVDGKSVTAAEVVAELEPEIAKWALDFERRAHETLERALDRMPKAKDGRDGIDGLGFDDMSFEQLDERNAVIRFKRGEVVKEFPIKLHAFVDRDVFSEGAEYLRGDGVTWGGSYFIARKDLPEGKPGQSPDWRLAVKRGRDGRDGERPATASTVRIKP